MTALISLLLVAATIAIHYEVLRLASGRITHLRIHARARIIIMQVAAMLSHLGHVVLYAAAYFVLERIGDFGAVAGPQGHSFGDAFYFSITCYTTLGIGDLYPTGSIRIISGVEALNGLVMVGWTASMTYLFMEKFWHLRGHRARDDI